MHDSQVMDELMEGHEQAVFADKSYDKDSLKKKIVKKESFTGSWPRLNETGAWVVDRREGTAFSRE